MIQGLYRVTGGRKHRCVVLSHQSPPFPSIIFLLFFSFCLLSLPFFLRPSLSLMAPWKQRLSLICMLCISCRVSHVPGVGGCRKQRTSVEPGKPLGGPPRRNIVGCRIQHIWKEGSMFTTTTTTTTTTISQHHYHCLVIDHFNMVPTPNVFLSCTMCLTDGDW